MLMRLSCVFALSKLVLRISRNALRMNIKGLKTCPFQRYSVFLSPLTIIWAINYCPDELKKWLL